MQNLRESLDGFISLKEASSISGYTPDYVGQLIRKGKLPGKQVYSNIAWVTTEEALRAYMQGAKDAKQSRGTSKSARGFKGIFQGYINRLRGELEAVTMFKTALYFLSGFALLFGLLLFFVFAVSLDAWISRRTAAVIGTETLPPVEVQSPL